MRCGGILSDEGIDILLATEARHVQGRSGGDVSLLVRTSSGEQTIEGSDILVAAGRSPNTTGIGLEVAGVELDSHGYIKVNERLETSAPDVWAIGECAGSPQFTHVSFDDFRIIRDNLADRDRGEPRGSTPPTPPGIRVRTAAVREVGLTGSEQGWETERSEVCIGKPQ